MKRLLKIAIEFFSALATLLLGGWIIEQILLQIPADPGAFLSGGVELLWLLTPGVSDYWAIGRSFLYAVLSTLFWEFDLEKMRF